MELAILALVLGPSCVVFLAGCVLALARPWLPQQRGAVRVRSRVRET